LPVVTGVIGTRSSTAPVHQAVQHASDLIGVADDLSDLLSTEDPGIAGDEGESLGLGIGAVGDFQEFYKITIATAFGTFGDIGGNADTGAADLRDEVALTAHPTGGSGYVLHQFSGMIPDEEI
jgi:hypothetical protein